LEDRRMSKLQVAEAVSVAERAARLDLPERVELSLGEIAGDGRDGLLALSVRVGLAVLQEMMEWEVDRVVGLKGRHDRERVANRHGHAQGVVTLGGRRVPVSRPRVRSVEDAREIGLESYREFTSRDPLSEVIAERILAGVSTRQYRRTPEPSGTTSRTSAARPPTRRSRGSSSVVPGPRCRSYWLAGLISWSWSR
jgi:putative transposase